MKHLLILAFVMTSASGYSREKSKFAFQDNNGKTQTIALNFESIQRDPSEKERMHQKWGTLLKLNTEDIASRDEALAERLRDQLESATTHYETTVRNVVDFLEKDFGVHVFHHLWSKKSFNKRRAFPSNNRDYYLRMRAFAIYSLAFDSYERYFTKNYMSKQKYSYKMWPGDEFLAGYPKDSLSRPFWTYKPSNLITPKTYDKMVRNQPVIRAFALALADSGVKALNATVVFAKFNPPYYGAVIDASPYQVIYPLGDPWLQVPQPLIFISDHATYDDFKIMIQKHAPLIYSYNHLVAQKIAGNYQHFIQKLLKHPSLTPLMEKELKSVKSYNRMRMVFEGFLMVNYALITGAATLTGGVVVAGLGAVAGTTIAATATVSLLTAPIWAPPVAGATAALCLYGNEVRAGLNRP